jgi:hypothetical protein
MMSPPDRRRWFRADCEIPVAYFIGRKETFYAATVLNSSIDGLYFVGDTAMTSGDDCHILIEKSSEALSRPPDLTSVTRPSSGVLRSPRPRVRAAFSASVFRLTDGAGLWTAPISREYITTATAARRRSSVVESAKPTGRFYCAPDVSSTCRKSPMARSSNLFSDVCSAMSFDGIIPEDRFKESCRRRCATVAGCYAVRSICP